MVSYLSDDVLMIWVFVKEQEILTRLLVQLCGQSTINFLNFSVMNKTVPVITFKLNQILV